VPYRLILPILQLVICWVVLFPLRDMFVSQFRQARTVPGMQQNRLENNASFSGRRDEDAKKNSQPARGWYRVEVISRSREELERMRDAEIRLTIPAALNGPVALLDAPFRMMQSPAQPDGQPFKLWRALIYPLIGMLFWWIAGRGIEAAIAAKRKIISPRLGPPEVLVNGLILFVASIVAVITVHEQSATNRTATVIAIGAGIWAVLSFVGVAARLMQWRVRRGPAA
jgi:hypothetical protein